MEFGTVSQQGDVSERRFAIDLFARRDVSDRCQRIAIRVTYAFSQTGR
jgi:hypothetical protein